MDLYFERLQKVYDGRAVVDIESEAIVGTECTAVVGPNGAGKSTLLNMIAGLMKPDSGTIYFESRGQGSRTDQVPFLDLTLVFQAPYLLSTTVEKNIMYPLTLRNWSHEDIQKRTGELLRDLRLEKYQQQKSWKLSGGEVQKVALARAISFHPKLLLLDEPTVNIDPATTSEIEHMLQKISKAGETKVILVTHNLAQVKRLCKQVAFMHQGKIVEQGTTETMLTNPKTELARKFVEGELLL